jgi:hypothetical protein
VRSRLPRRSGWYWGCRYLSGTYILLLAASPLTNGTRSVSTDKGSSSAPPGADHECSPLKPTCAQRLTSQAAETQVWLPRRLGDGGQIRPRVSAMRPRQSAEGMNRLRCSRSGASHTYT